MVISVDAPEKVDRLRFPKAFPSSSTNYLDVGSIDGPVPVEIKSHTGEVVSLSASLVTVARIAPGRLSISLNSYDDAPDSVMRLGKALCSVSAIGSDRLDRAHTSARVVGGDGQLALQTGETKSGAFAVELRRGYSGPTSWTLSYTIDADDSPDPAK